MLPCGEDISADNLIEVVREMPKLQALELYFISVKIDDNLFKAIREIINKRPDSRPLEILLRRENEKHSSKLWYIKLFIVSAAIVFHK